ncbi:MAG: hypothetical protein ACFE0I_12155 [Elainellaceae cyanobacterium]
MANRWWIYQQQQFPLLRNSLLAGGLSLASVSHSVLLRARALEELPIDPILWIGTILIAFIGTLLFFLQLQIIQEFQGTDKKGRYTLSRPVAEGLVSLKELGILGICAGIVQLGLSLSLNISLLLPLIVLWGFITLKHYHFFAELWLDAHPFVKTIAHAAAVPIASFYATACDWISVQIVPPPGLIWFLLVGWLSWLAIAIARNLHPSSAQSNATIPLRWSPQIAMRAWLGIIWLLTLTLFLSSMYVQFVFIMMLMLVALLAGSIYLAWRFVIRPAPQWGMRLEAIAQLWLVLAYLGIGPLALLAMLSPFSSQ